MKKVILSLFLTLTSFQLIAQANYYNNDGIELTKRLEVIKTVIIQSKYIVETVWLKDIKYDEYYYIKADNQSYYRILMRVIKVIRGPEINVGDTIIAIWKQEYKGNGPDNRNAASSAPRLWYEAGISTSCLFLVDSKYPNEPIPDIWSRFKHTTYLSSSIGYFASCYDTYVGDRPGRIGAYIQGIIFNQRYEWYDYLRTFPEINLPKQE